MDEHKAQHGIVAEPMAFITAQGDELLAAISMPLLLADGTQLRGLPSP